jgi:hypothetical protein
MIVQNTLLAKGFAICTGGMSPNETAEMPNDSDAKYMQIGYLYTGSITVSQGSQNVEIVAKTLTDLTSFSSTPVNVTAGNQGLTWMSVNPIPMSKRYNITLATVGDSVITSTTQECIVLCVDKSVVCNSKTLNGLQYLRVPNGTSVNLNVPEGAVALVMTA